MTDNPINDDNTNNAMPGNANAGDVGSGSTKKVGYGSPPLHSRFQKGTSGNPYGRHKNRPTVDEILLTEADRLVKVQENGRSKKMTIEQVIYARQTRSAARGNLKDIKALLALMSQYELKYGWGNVGWNMKPNYFETVAWKKEMESLGNGRLTEVDAE